MVSILAGGLLSSSLAWAHPLFPEPPRFQLGPTNSHISRAQEQIEQGDFEEAVKTLQAGLDSPDVTDDQLVELYRLLGMASLYLGDEARAREAYERLLQARPDFELPRTAPPKLRSLYARIKEDIKSRRVRPVTLHVDPIPDPEGGVPVQVEARIENMALGAKAKLFYRRAGDEAYNSVDFSRQRGSKEQYQAILPAYEIPAEASPYEMEYYFEVADAAQRRLAGRGDPFNPLIFQVAPLKAASTATAVSTSRPWYKSPWLWVAVGAVAVGGTAAGVALASSEDRGRVPVKIRVNPATP
jgi:tetratricopeptide (TPR) repeat protein